MKKFLELLFLQQLKGVGKALINKKYIDTLQAVEGLDACAEIVRKVNPDFDNDAINQAMVVAKKKFETITGYSDIHVITVFDEEYPKRLFNLKNKKPVILYVKGNLEILNKKGVSVIGTRAPSPLTYEVAPPFVKDIVKAGFVVVSGLALGCDTIGHENALCNKGLTIAVLPSGIHNIYPESNKQLAEDIVKSGGCLISEYEPKATAVSYTFVERDALIAALSKATLVLECGIKSGTMKTVEVAEKLNRKIACYYSKRKIKEGFEGNNYILNTKTSYKVVNKKGLRSFLSLVDAEGEAEVPIQISLL